MENAMIEVRNIEKNYSPFRMNNISFDVPQGYITGIIGPNGAGKSTLIKMIMGMIQPDGGTISVGGQNVNLSAADFKEQIGYVSDENLFYDYITLDQMKKIIAPFYSRWDDDLYAKYMDLFELPSRKKINECSKGMKMKYAITIALSHHPKLLIMDEPTAGLDPVFRRELLDLFGEYILDESNSILFSTHITTDLDRIADYITFLNRGKLIFSDSKDDVKDKYVIIKGSAKLLDQDVRKLFIHIRETGVGFEALAENRKQVQSIFEDQVVYQQPTLEDIMYYTAKRGQIHES